MKNITTTVVALLILCFNTTRGQQEDAGVTPATLAVSPTGAVTYHVPIINLPTVKNVAPSISLDYNGQSTNNLVGYGWRIGGLSTISRIASTKYHDGELDPIDFDNLDRFSLDGQRLLLKSGTYGASGSTYETENYSNIKIEAIGVSPYGKNYGPSNFVVTHPDGTTAWYGLGTSRGRLEWAIHKTQDAQGNFIEYDYLTNRNLLRISSIKYGSRAGTASPNKIQFNYKSRKRREEIIIENLDFGQVYILDRIEVHAGSKLFRKYQLKHQTTSLGYEKVISITETNGVNKSLRPISFTYKSNFQNAPIVNSEKTFSIPRSSSLPQGIDGNKHDIISGEFDGDDKLDIVIYDKAKRDKLFFVTKFGSVSSGQLEFKSINTSKFVSAFASTTLNPSFRITGQQGITAVINSGNKYNFTTYLKEGSNITQKSRSWLAPTYEEETYCGATPKIKSIPREFISGDFNGDGLTDVLAVQVKYNYQYCIRSIGDGCPSPFPSGTNNFGDTESSLLPIDECCECQNGTNNSSGQTYFIDIAKQGSNFTNYAGSIGSFDEGNSRLIPADFNGDGKTDILKFTEGNVSGYSLSTDNQLNRVFSFSHSAIKLDHPALIGDYNGDGNYDFMIPKGDGDRRWTFFYGYSNGYKVILTNEFTDIVYRENNTSTEGENQINSEYHYIVQDFTKDGKTDILFHEIKYIYDRWGFKESNEAINLYVNKPENSQFATSFVKGDIRTYKHNWLNKRGIPVYANFTNKVSDANYSLLAGNTLLKFSLDKKLEDELKLITVEKNYITTNIIYDEDRTSATNSVYQKDNSSTYPYMDISSMKGVSLVSELIERSTGINRYKKFRYFGAKSHTQGFGFLGFKVYSQTNWHGDGVGTLWTNVESDPLKRGATKREWVSENAQSSPSNYSSLVTNTFTEQLKANKRYNLRIKSKTTNNALEGYSIKEEYLYDPFNNPTKITTSYTGGSKVVNLSYFNNSSGSGKNYYIGRLKQKRTTATLKTESFSTSESYQYANNLLTVKKVSSNGSPENTFYYSYDLFGNVITKVDASAGFHASSYKYDTSGRYMISSKDHFGLETKQTFNTSTGTLKTLTDPHGTKINFEYDGWNRETESYEKTIYKTKSVYSKNGRFYNIQLNTDNGPKTFTQANQYGWVLAERSRGLKGRFIYIAYKYDVAGRIIARSEPYYSAQGATQWNKTYYDLYGRVISEESYTGQVVTTTYDKMKVTVNDGTKTVTTEKDIAGNAIKVTDPGGTITYSYFANGEIKEANYNSHKVTSKIDKWGRRIELNDPSAGIYKYVYNDIGQLLEEQTPKAGKTVYKYLSNGLLQSEKKYENGALSTNTDYTYDGKHRLVKTSMNDVRGNKNHTYINETVFNTRNQITKNTEVTINSNGQTTYTNLFTYDDYNRIIDETLKTEYTAWALTSEVKTKNRYDAYGNLVEIYDYNTNKSLWRLDDENERGQTTSVTLGNGVVKKREYDSYGYLKRIHDYKQHTNHVSSALDMIYEFDHKRGLLKNRTNQIFSRNESFTYDSQDRLTRISGAINETQSYDSKGLIQINPNIGTYKYNGQKKYQLSNVDLNNLGKNHYELNPYQNVEYDAFKRPLKITERNKDRIDFLYGLSGNRSGSKFYGTDSPTGRAEITKSYSSIMPVEIISEDRNNKLEARIITYIGGNAYSAPIAHITNQTIDSNSKEYYYIHRDYLGSVLGLTNDKGEVEELMHYGAWGSVDILVNGSRFSNNDIGLTKLQRGFTGHEHLDSVGLVHMNGRLYDSKLRRFLSADNYIQDPYNTQSFNRYSYVWNNPLNFNDPNGEWIGFVVGAIVGAYLGGAAVNGSFNPAKWDWSSGKTWAGIIGGALLGGFSGGQIQAGNMNLFVSAGAHVNSVTIPIVEVSINAGYAQLAALGGLAVFGKEIFNTSDNSITSNEDPNPLDIIENSKPQWVVETGELVITGIDRTDYDAPYPAIGDLRGIDKLLTEIQVNNPQIFGPRTTPDGTRYLSTDGYPYGWVPKQSNGIMEWIGGGPKNITKLRNFRKFRSFTKSNYRFNLKVLTGRNGKGFDAHHMFPQADQFKAKWQRLKINPHNPVNMKWWRARPHRQQAYQFNKEWERFFRKTPNPTRGQAFRFKNYLIEKYGLK